MNLSSTTVFKLHPPTLSSPPSPGTFSGFAGKGLTLSAPLTLLQFVLYYKQPTLVASSLHSLRGTMCLEHPPHFRARLVTYLSLIVNNMVPPSDRGWADVIEFEDHRLLNSTCDPSPQPSPASDLNAPLFGRRSHGWWLVVSLWAQLRPCPSD